MKNVEPIRDKKKIERIKIYLREKNFRDFLLFHLGINSGLRISDILKLKVKDVKKHKYIIVNEQKTKKRKRFPITKSFKKDLEIYIRYKSPSDWLFKSRKGNKPISRVQAYRIIRKACRKNGIRSCIGTHTLRKTFGYHFYKETKDIAMLQYLFNHSNQSTTLRYIGINQEMIDTVLGTFGL